MHKGVDMASYLSCMGCVRKAWMLIVCVKIGVGYFNLVMYSLFNHDRHENVSLNYISCLYPYIRES